MGVSGCGKSTIAKLVSEALGIPFFDGDDFHPQSNIDKMASGNALNDNDRKKWLHRLNKHAQEQLVKDGAIIACSALKETYREKLQEKISTSAQWVFLKGDIDLIKSRLESRTNHFMPANLLQSQFDTLEIPEYGLHVDISKPPKEIVKTIIKEFNI